MRELAKPFDLNLQQNKVSRLMPPFMLTASLMDNLHAGLGASRNTNVCILQHKFHNEQKKPLIKQCPTVSQECKGTRTSSSMGCKPHLRINLICGSVEYINSDMAAMIRICTMGNFKQSARKGYSALHTTSF